MSYVCQATEVFKALKSLSQSPCPIISSSTFPLLAMQTSVLAFTILSAASATIFGQRNPCTPFVDTFDDRNAGLLPLFSAVGTYHGLN